MEKTNDEKPMITIGMPIHNGEKFLQQKLESFNDQTLKNYQLIISDNASTDKTEEICKKFMQNDKRIIYFRKEKNIGAIQNFYFVLNKAKTKYFVWSAVDDFMYPNFLESNIGYLEIDKNVVGSISKIEYFDDDGNRKNIKQ